MGLHIDTENCSFCGICLERCPSGAIFLVANGWSPTRVVVQEDACTHCGLCLEACPEGAVLEVLEPGEAHPSRPEACAPELVLTGKDSYRPTEIVRYSPPLLRGLATLRALLLEKLAPRLVEAALTRMDERTEARTSRNARTLREADTGRPDFEGISRCRKGRKARGPTGCGPHQRGRATGAFFRAQ